MIAKIIVDHRSKKTDRFFDYLVPSELEDKMQIGSRVLVPFARGNKEIEGFCMGFSEKSGSRTLKSIIKRANYTPGFDAEMLAVIEWMHKKYLSSYLEMLLPQYKSSS